MYCNPYQINLFQSEPSTDDNANIRRQTNDEGLRKSFPSSNSLTRIAASLNYANNNTPAPRLEKPRNKALLPLESFPDPPYSKQNDHTEPQTINKRLCRNFQDILDSTDTYDCSVLSRASTPSQSSHVEFISLIQYFQQVTFSNEDKYECKSLIA